MHAIQHHHHVALKGALSTAAVGVPSAARRWNPYGQQQQQLVTPSSSPPNHTLSPTTTSIPLPLPLDAAKQLLQPQIQLPPQVIRRDERTRHAGSLVDSAVQLLSEIWPQPPSHFHSGLRPTRHGSMSSVTGSTLTYVKPTPDPITVPSFQSCQPISPHSPNFVRRSNSLPGTSWPSGPAMTASDAQPLTASPPSLQEPAPAPTNPTHNQIPLKTFVYEVLRRSRTSMSILQAGLFYLEGVRSTVEELRRDEEEEILKKREVEELQRLKTMQGDGIIDWSGNGSNDAVLSKKTEPEATTEAASSANPCGYFAMVDKIEDDVVDDFLKPIDIDTSLEARLTPPLQFPTPPAADRSANVSPLTTANDRMDCDSLKEDIRAKKSTLSPLLDPRRTFLASLLLASKFLQDRAYSNKAWSKLSGLDPREISRCERALGEALGWRLWVGRDNSIGTDPSFSNLACFPALASAAVPGGGPCRNTVVRSTQSESDLALSRRRASGPVFAGGCKRTTDSAPTIAPIKGTTNTSGKTPTHVVAAECRAANLSASALAARRRLVAHQPDAFSPALTGSAPIAIVSPQSSHHHWSHTPTSSAGSSPPSSVYSATPASSFGINTPASSVVDFSFAFAMGAANVKAEIQSTKSNLSFPNGTNFPACSVGGINPTMVGAWVSEISQFRQTRTENSVVGSDFESFYNKTVGGLPQVLENSFFSSSVDEIVGTA